MGAAMTGYEIQKAALEFFENFPDDKKDCFLVSPCQRFLICVADEGKTIWVKAKIGESINIKETWKFNAENKTFSVTIENEQHPLSSIFQELSDKKVEGGGAWHPRQYENPNLSMWLSKARILELAYDLSQLIKNSSVCSGTSLIDTHHVTIEKFEYAAMKHLKSLY